MARITIELAAGCGVAAQDGRFVAAVPGAADLAAQLQALAPGPVERAFGRDADVLDVERAARAGGPPLPDLNAFVCVDGDAAALAAHAGVASAVAEGPPELASSAARAGADDQGLHARDARGQGVGLVALGAAPGLASFAPEAEIDLAPPFVLLGDAVDRATAGAGHGDVLLVLCPVATPAARAAVRHALARGVTVVTLGHPGAPPPAGVLVAAAPDEAVALAGRAACAQSYAHGVGLGRLPPSALAALPLAGPRPTAALDELDRRVAQRPAERPHARVVLERAEILRGGDIGAAEIYFEGWVDAGAGRVTFRIPHEGHIPGVRDGQIIPLDAEVFRSRGPVGEHLVVHIEAWDEDFGRTSLINPDDLLGAYEHRFGADERWGAGRHADLLLKTDVGAWKLSFRVELTLPAEKPES